MRISPSGATAAATARSDWSRDGSSTDGSAPRTFRSESLRGFDGAPYVEDVATAASESAVDPDALSKARFAVGGRGSRCSLSTPGAVGPPAVGMSSTYWATDDASGFGGSRCA